MARLFSSSTTSQTSSHKTRGCYLGAITTQLSSVVAIVYYQFKIAVDGNQYLLSIHEAYERHSAINEVYVTVINKMSMLFKLTFDMVILQIVDIINSTLLDPFKNKMDILFSDLAQSPLVCKHEAEFCRPCQLTSSTHWVHTNT